MDGNVSGMRESYKDYRDFWLALPELVWALHMRRLDLLLSEKET